MFLNRIGGGEKPLVSAALPTFDASRKTLLTADELNGVAAHQRSLRAEQGIADTDLERIRKGMLGFLLSAVVESGTESQKSTDIFREAQGHVLDTGTDKQKAALGEFMQRQFELGEAEAGRALQFVMQQCVANIDLLRVSGVPIEVLPSRFSKLSQYGSPFLKFDFRFDNSNFDATLHPHDSSQTRRINLASIHLLSRGIDEMGASHNGSHDQTYLTAAEYVAMANSQPAPEMTSRAEQVDLVATRLLAQAQA